MCLIPLLGGGAFPFQARVTEVFTLETLSRGVCDEESN